MSHDIPPCEEAGIHRGECRGYPFMQSHLNGREEEYSYLAPRPLPNALKGAIRLQLLVGIF